MTDQVAGQPAEGTATPTGAGLSQADIDKIIEARIAGFQSKVIAPKDELIQALQYELKELKTAGLSEDELAQLRETEKDRELADLRAQLELRTLAGEFPDEAPYFERLLKAGDTRSQLAVMAEFRSAIAPKPAAADPDPSVVPSEVDANRASRSATGAGTPITAPDGQTMTSDLADQILNTFGRLKR